MTEHHTRYFGEEEQHPLPPPCSYCHAQAEYEDDDPIPHLRHEADCQVGERIRTLFGNSKT